MSKPARFIQLDPVSAELKLARRSAELPKKK